MFLTERHNVSFLELNISWLGFFLTTDLLAQLVEFRTYVREVVGSNPGRTNIQGLKITENVLPLQ